MGTAPCRVQHCRGSSKPCRAAAGSAPQAGLQLSARSKVSAKSLVRPSPSPEDSNDNTTVPKLLSQPHSRGTDQQSHVRAQPCPATASWSLPAPGHTAPDLGSLPSSPSCSRAFGDPHRADSKSQERPLLQLGRTTSSSQSTALQQGHPWAGSPSSSQRLARTKEEYLQSVVLGFIWALSSCSSR